MTEKGRHPWLKIGRTLEVDLNQTELNVAMIEIVQDQMRESGTDTLIFKNTTTNPFGLLLRAAQVGWAIEQGKYECIQKQAAAVEKQLAGVR